MVLKTEKGRNVCKMGQVTSSRQRDREMKEVAKRGGNGG